MRISDWSADVGSSDLSDRFRRRRRSQVEEATMPDKVEKKTGRATRRKFLTGAAVAAVGTVAMPNVSRAQTTALTMQSSWPVSDIFQEMAKQYADRVGEMSGGRLKVDRSKAHTSELQSLMRNSYAV